MNKNLTVRIFSFFVIFSMLLSALGVPTRAVQAVTLDYGDAPDIYKTLWASDGARHSIVMGFSLGPTVDGEPDGQPSPLADGDDLNLVPDDEDGVSVPASIEAGSWYSINVVTGTLGGMLDAWIDFNRDGDFDSDERLWGSVTMDPGPSGDMWFGVPEHAAGGVTYARFRLSSLGNLLPYGYAADGEVEDYKVTIIGAPNYTVIFDNNGGSGTMSNQVANVPTALTLNTFTRLGYSFSGWNTQADGLGTTYADGTTYPFEANETLYAQWTVEEPTMDYGDAPDLNYQTLLASNGACHGIVPGVFSLGPLVDAEPDGQPSPLADGDDLNPPIGLDDEDGVTFPAPFVAGDPAALVIVDGGPSGGLLDAWIDFNGNGTFEHPAEHLWVVAGVSQSQALAPGVNPPLTFAVPANAVLGPTYARFRLSTVGGLPPFGFGGEGEVEDYLVMIHLFTLDYAAGTGGSLSGNLNQAVAYGGDGTAVTALADPGYSFISWDDGVTDNPRTDTNVTANVNVTAIFTFAQLEGDYGDAPDSYQTLLASDGARHAIVPGVFSLGPLVDAEPNGQPSLLADGDDNNPLTGPDDEDGVTLPAVLIAGDPAAQVTVDGGPSGGMLDAWIDFDGSGTFDPPEHLWGGVSQWLAAGPQQLPLTFAVPAGAMPGPTYARFRLSINGNMPPFGFAPYGEVEDYRVMIETGTEPMDYGDAPDPTYPTLLASNGARHMVIQGFNLGQFVDLELDGQPSQLANGDDINPPAGPDDEDGVILPASFTSNDPAAAFTVFLTNAAGLPAKLDAWIDFNTNGVFDHPAEHLWGGTSQPLVTGPNPLTFAVPAGPPWGTTYARFRLSMAGGLPPFGFAPDGEVEDYLVEIGPEAQTGTIIVEKQTEPDGNPRPFTFSGDAAGDISDGGLIVVSGLQPGAYSSTETVPSSWTLRQITCDATDSTVDLPNHTAHFQLEAGETVKCTFYNVSDLDYGDAPDSYKTLWASDGARHRMGGVTIFMGASVDSEADGQPTVPADGDDLAGDDEDGVTLPAVLVAGNAAAQVTVDGGPTGGKLDAWIDFNGNGTFENPAEHLWAGVSQVVAAGANQLVFAVPAGAVPGTTYARFRLSVNGNLPPFGFAPDGEVEDYRVMIETGTEPMDYGDAPNSYKTLLASDGARHMVIQGFSLGPRVDLELDGQPSPLADGDDNNPLTGPDDEDGVTFAQPFLIQGDPNAVVYVNLVNAAGLPAKLDAWIDFNGNGAFDPAEHLWGGVSQLPLLGLQGFQFAVPANAVLGWTYARFRLSSAGNLPPFGFAPNGEVEDYTVEIRPNTGTIIVEKLTVPHGMPDFFTFTGDVHGSISDGGQMGVGGLAPGAYSSTETVPSSWTLYEITCDDGESTGDLLTHTANFVLQAGETVKCTFTNVSFLDYGDAPDSYKTLHASDGARHWMGGTVDFMGSYEDAEADGQPSVPADGDDLAGLDDEDGVILPAILVAGDPAAQVTVDGGLIGGKLDAWIDFNGNTIFDDPAEHLWGGASQPLVAGPNPVLTFAVPAGAVPGPTYARFRLSINGNLPPIGFAPDGEVEDYRVVIEAAPEPMDYGDAPDPTYPTLLASNGARHMVIPNFNLGQFVDVELDGQPSQLANGDDINPPAGPDDEDGVTLPAVLIAGDPAAVATVILVNAGGLAAKLDAWIDFNGNGAFDPAEHLWGGVSQTPLPGVQGFQFAVPANAVTGLTYARFRLSTLGNMLPTGLAPDGEVEDYRVVIQATHSLSLVTGWNLVSFPLHPTSTVITDVLSSLGSNYDLVYAWDASGGHSGAGNWMRYAPGIPGNTLATLDETQGFWIRMTSADTLDITGTVPTTTNISLLTTASGWNLVGYPSDETRGMPEALTSHGVSDYSLVYAYHANDADTWKRYAPGVPGNDLLELAPGWGYWIKVGTTSTWHVEY